MQAGDQGSNVEYSSRMLRVRGKFITGLLITAAVFVALELAGQTGSGLKAAPEPDANKQIKNIIHTDFYEVRGTNAAALLASLRAHQMFTNHASTVWRVEWSFEYLPRPQECILRSFNVRVVVRYLLPQWVDSQRADKALQEEWNRYFGALQVHESGHGGVGVGAGKEILRQVNSREWRARDGKELKARLDEACEKILHEFRAREAAYDKMTDHGRTQGAHLRITRH